MASALGTLTIVEGVKDPVGPLFVDRCTLTGDADYLTGGTVGLLAALRAAKAMPDLEIVSLQGEGDNGDFRLEYDHDADGVRHGLPKEANYQYVYDRRRDIGAGEARSAKMSLMAFFWDKVNSKPRFALKGVSRCFFTL